MSDTHPEPAEIAALDAELLPPDEAAALRGHLAGCPSCSGILADLNALSRELGAFPSPPIPPDVAARIDAALMAEAAAATVSRETSPARRRRWPQLALAAAAALAVLGLGSTLVQNVDSGADSEAGASSDEADLITGAEGGQRDSAAESDPLEQQVRELLAQAETSPEAPFDSGSDAGASAEPEESTTGHGVDDGPGAASLPPCVWSAIGRTEAPLAAAEEDYEGQDAYVVVLPHADDPDRVDAYAVDADCAADPSADVGEILAQASYPRER
jgi:hypothetical protein